MLEGQRCRGENLAEFAHGYAFNNNQLHLEWIIDAYQQLSDKDFFTNYFNLLSGDKKLRNQIEQGLSADEIRASWKDEIDAFMKIQSMYLMYWVPKITRFFTDIQITVIYQLYGQKYRAEFHALDSALFITFVFKYYSELLVSAKSLADSQTIIFMSLCLDANGPKNQGQDHRPLARPA